MDIGSKIRRLRQQNGLTQKELADRCELSKGFISQLESDQTSPSLSTLEDILTALGSSFSDFFKEEKHFNPVCRREDVFIKEENGTKVYWLIPDAQKRDMEAILVHLSPGARTQTVLPHAGEEFGHVLQGSATLAFGDKAYRLRKKDSFFFKGDKAHKLSYPG